MLKYKGLTFEKDELINILVEDGYQGTDEVVQLLGCTTLDLPDSTMTINGFPQTIGIPAILIQPLGTDIIDTLPLYPHYLDILKVDQSLFEKA